MFIRNFVLFIPTGTDSRSVIVQRLYVEFLFTIVNLFCSIQHYLILTTASNGPEAKLRTFCMFNGQKCYALNSGVVTEMSFCKS